MGGVRHSQSERGCESDPDNLSDVEAAAVPVAYLAAQLALTKACGLQKGQTVLVPGVGGAVANAAIQLARVHGAGRIITSAGRQEKADQARDLGYTDVVDLSEERLSQGVMRLTDGKGADVALDSIGGAVTGEALGLARDGRKAHPDGLSGRHRGHDRRHDTHLEEHEHRGLQHVLPAGRGVRRGLGSSILDLLSSERVKPVIDRAYPLEQAAEAQRHLIEDRPFGKVVLTI